MELKFFISITFIFLTFPISLLAQAGKENQRVLIIYDENGFVNSDEQGLFHYLISIKSKDSLFERDGYKFIINNQTGFGKYSDLKEVGQKISLDTLKYQAISDLTQYSNCELHDLLSLQKKIYVIFKSKDKLIYWRYPIIYTGTQRNVEMLKM